MTKESASYENLIGEKVTQGDVSLEDALGEKIVETVSENTDDHWKGLPEFEQNQEQWKTLNIKFRNEEDMNAFSKLIGQKLTKKTKGIWYPPHEEEENFLMRWVNDE